MFNKDQFIENCKLAVGEGQKAIRELVLEAVDDPAGIIRELGAPTQAGVFPLYGDDHVTVINFVWAPHMTLLPHDHKMFAAIGIYGGREDNVFWRRIDEDKQATDGPMIEAAGAESLGLGQVATLGRDIVHSVANPIGKLTSALHVYGGNFFEPPVPRLQWDHESLQQEPWDMNHTHAVFSEAKVRYQAGLDAGLQPG
jgi:predicted metal-dependent enzyme (double-stranded beta helix superfamily)